MVLIVLLVLLLASPLGVGMAVGGACSPGSGPSCTALMGSCFAVLVTLILLGGSLIGLMALLDPRGSALQLVRLLYRPPRVALLAP